MKITTDRSITSTGEPVFDPRADIIESRVFFRRRLAEKITITLLQETMRKGTLLSDYYANGAQYIEDLANAIAERVAAREDKELLS